jgi:hypothetical protein
MILSALMLGSALAQTNSCDDVAVPDAQVQIAWISPLRRTVGSGTWIEVVRVVDLEGWLSAETQDPTRLLQVLGMKGRRTKEVDVSKYKITVFDVDAAWLCRPLEGGTPGETHAGVSVCETGQQKPLWGHRKGFTGCGYSMDTGASARGLDVYRVRWAEASTQGFCVFPLDRFIEAN